MSPQRNFWAQLQQKPFRQTNNVITPLIYRRFSEPQFLRCQVVILQSFLTMRGITKKVKIPFYYTQFSGEKTQFSSKDRGLFLARAYSHEEVRSSF